MAENTSNQSAEDVIAKYADNPSVEYKINVLSVDPQNAGLRKIRINIIDTETQQSIEEVDVLTSATSVLFDNNRTLPEELDARFQYTNTKPMALPVGGLEAGSTFVNTTYQEIFNRLLYPYGAPTVTISVNGKTDTQYVAKGDGSIEMTPFTVNVVQGSELIPTIQLFKDGLRVALIPPFPDNTGGTTTYVYTGTFNANTVFKAAVTDGKSLTYDSNEIDYVFNDPIYVGLVEENAAVNEAFVKALSGRHYDYKTGMGEYNITNSVLSNPSEKCYFIAVPNYVNIASITDANNFVITKSFNATGTVGLTFDGYLGLVDYKWYRSNKTTQSNFPITFHLTV